MWFTPLQEIPSCSAGKRAEGTKGMLVVMRTVFGQRFGKQGEALLQVLSPLPVPWQVAGLVPVVRLPEGCLYSGHRRDGPGPSKQ